MPEANHLAGAVLSMRDRPASPTGGAPRRREANPRFSDTPRSSILNDAGSLLHENRQHACSKSSAETFKWCSIATEPGASPSLA
jgi:hypothetical protein